MIVYNVIKGSQEDHHFSIVPIVIFITTDNFTLANLLSSHIMIPMFLKDFSYQLDTN